MSLEVELKRLVEVLHPDLRPYMRFALTGRVAAVYEDEYAVDVVVTGDVSLPHVPVSTLWAMNAGDATWGIWALPEIDSEVTVGFREGDVTRPYVEACLYPPDKAPKGHSVGMFVIRDRHGQRIEFKPDDGEWTLKVDNRKAVVAGNDGLNVLRNRRSEIAGDDATVVGKHRSDTVGGDWRQEVVGNVRQTTGGEVQQEAGRLSQTVRGDSDRKVGGSTSNTVSGNTKTVVLGAQSEAVAKQWQKIVGGTINITIANADAADIALALSVLTGKLRLSTEEGGVEISTKLGDVVLRTLSGDVVVVSDVGRVKLGSSGATSPGVLGTELVQTLTDLVNLFTSAIAIVQSPTPAGPVPTPLDPALNGQLQAWVGGLASASFLSAKVAVA